MVYGNVGDCRIALVSRDDSRGIETVSLTVDHVPADPDESARIKRQLAPLERCPIRPSLSCLRTWIESHSTSGEAYDLEDIHSLI